MLHFPNELVDSIISHCIGLAAKHDAFSIRREAKSNRLRSLAQLCRVSRSYHAYFTPRLHTYAVIFDHVIWLAYPDRQLPLSSDDELLEPAYPSLLAPLAGRPEPFLTSDLLPSTPEFKQSSSLGLVDGPVVAFAAATGNTKLLERLLHHFPPENLLPKTCTTTKRIPHQPPANRYFSSAFFFPARPCQHIQRCENHVRIDPLLDTFLVATGLHVAALNGNEGTVAWLLDHGVEIDHWSWCLCICPYPWPSLVPNTDTNVHLHVLYDHPSVTPLHAAICRKHTSVAKLLIKRGAVWDRPMLRTISRTALSLASSLRQADLVEWLVENCKCSASRLQNHFHDWPDDMGLYAIHHATITQSRSSSASCPRSPPLSHIPEEDLEEITRRLITSLLHLGVFLRQPDMQADRLKSLEPFDSSMLGEVENYCPSNRGRTDASQIVFHPLTGLECTRFERHVAFEKFWYDERREMEEIFDDIGPPCDPVDFALEHGDTVLAHAIRKAV